MSATRARTPSTSCQHELFEAQAQCRPDEVAVVFDDASLTYAQLDARANRLAHHLRGLGVGADVLVGVCLPRSLDLAVALLAVLKAGGACVPLDPTYPPDRLRFMVTDAALAAVITSDALAGRLPRSGARLIRTDADADAWASRPLAPPPREVGPDDVAYVIYTSGSTGEPKGVLLTHRGLVNHHRVAAELYALGPGDRVLQFCSIGFDASIEELFPTWAAGATVVFRPDDVPLLGRGWLGWLRDRRIGVLNLPTAYWHEWTRDLHRLGEVVPDCVRLVIVGGEKAQGRALRTWLRVGGDRIRWVNAYGPTEATCMTTVYQREPGGGLENPADDRDPPIGRALPNSDVRVVDERGDPVAPGVTGELLIGGVGLARGYLNHPELTSQRFITGAGDVGPGARLYRTGDLVRMLADGDLEYVGRIDDQVKIRGFRVECGEVEAALAAHPGVAEAVVVARLDPSGHKRLAAYVVAAGNGAVTASELRRSLLDRLPDHMVPSELATVDAFPLTPNGKVDRAALASVEPTGPADDRLPLRPRSPTEERLAAIWADVLGVDVARVGVDDDFFELGGHSLLAAQVIAQVREEFGTETVVRAIFEASTVAALAALVEAEAAGDLQVPPLARMPRVPGARFPLSMAQEQMWALELAADPPGLYNITAITRIRRPVDESSLRKALAYMVERHETLRTAVSVESGRPQQVVVPTVPVKLDVVDLGGTHPAEREPELRRRIADQDAAPFDPARAPLFRAQLLHLGEEASQLVVTIDHLIADGTSAEIFMNELIEAYDAISGSRAPEHPPLEVQFADFAAWQRRWVTEDVLQAQLDWWANALEGMPLGPAVPFDRVPDQPTRRITSRSLTVPADTYGLLQELARASHGSVFIVCAAAVQALFSRYGGLTDVVLSTTLNGRQRTELEGLIGMFAGVGRIRTDLSGDPSFEDIVGRARSSILGMFEHQDIPFMRVRKAVLPNFPTAGPEVAAALPVELGYFHSSGAGRAEQELFFRGQLHPLSVSLLDDGVQIAGEFSYKLDFYEERTISQLVRGLCQMLEVVARSPGLRLSQLPAPQQPVS